MVLLTCFRLLIYNKLGIFFVGIRALTLRVTVRHKNTSFSKFDKRIAQAYYLIFFLLKRKPNVLHTRKQIGNSFAIVRTRVEYTLFGLKS